MRNSRSTEAGGPASAARVPAAEFIEVEGVRLRFSIEGRGRPLLLLNGIGAPLELLEPFRRALPDAETISIDMPGTGRSQAMRLPHRLDTFARIAHRALDVLGYREVDVLGVSWGGVLAQAFARRYRKRVRRLVLAATTHGWPSVPGHPRALWALMTPRRYTSPTYFAEVAPVLYGGAARTNPDLLREHSHLRFIRPPSLHGYLYQLVAVSTWAGLPWLHQIDRPALVLAADDDPIVPLVNARVLARGLRNARLHVVRDGGHLFLITHAAEVASVVGGFLDAEA